MSAPTARPDAAATSADLVAVDAGDALSWRDARRLTALVGHLAGRRLQSMHRLTLLGWLWPLARQLVQLAVLVFLFGHVLKLAIPDYPLYVFSGLLVWNWFQSGVLMAASTFIADRHLVFSPRLPNAVLPLAAIIVPLVDTLMALPILVVALAATGHLHPTILLLVPLLIVLSVLIGGLALLVATLNVFVRDIENVVTVGLMLLFYLTPVFYEPSSLPTSFKWVLTVNPMASVVSAARAVVLQGTLPTGSQVASIAVGTALAAVLGTLVFRRLNGYIIDEL